MGTWATSIGRSGSPSANLLTISYANRLAEAMLLGRGGRFGVTARLICPWHERHAYFWNDDQPTSNL